MKNLNIMKNLNQYIQEKYLIDTDTKITCTKKEIDNIVNNALGPWLFEKDEYKGTKNNRFEFLKEFDNNIMDLIDYFQGSAEELADKLKMDVNEFARNVIDNNEELYKQCKIYYRDIYDEIVF